MRRVHLQGLACLPAVAPVLPEGAQGPAWEAAQWTVQGPEGPGQAVPRDLDSAELVQAVTAAALADAGLGRADVGFICSGSSDYHQGQPFSFVMALDGAGAWPPQRESHVEMDGAWALYEAFVRLQHGDVDVALVYAFGRSSVGDARAVLTQQLDPYFLQPLGPGPLALAALQARLLIGQGWLTEADLAAEVARRFALARRNPRAAAWASWSPSELLDRPLVASPLRAHDGAVGADGAAAVVLVAEGSGPVLAGIGHECEAMDLGSRALTRSTSSRGALDRARDMARRGERGGKQIDAAFTAAATSPHALLLQRELGLLPDQVDPDGGAMVGEVPMVTGLARLVAAAECVRSGATRALAHATQGPLLQQNLVALLERP